nr:PEP-CTERM/exosortase system-associated acyltransferase [Colwellia echini]
MQFLQPHIALNDTLKVEAFKIRHNVYCEELAYEDMRANGQETDEFDYRSTFSLIQHIESQHFTSCVRLVTSNSESELLPIEKYCSSSITNKDFRPEAFARHEIGEISRLAVRSSFRRRKADNFKGCATGVISEITYSETELRCFPFIAIGLYMSAAIMCMKQGIKHTYVMMEPRLARSMKFVGINFKQLGPAVDYHGLRAPYYIKPTDFTAQLSPDFMKLYNIIEKNISAQLSHTKHS